MQNGKTQNIAKQKKHMSYLFCLRLHRFQLGTLLSQSFPRWLQRARSNRKPKKNLKSFYKQNIC